MTVPHDPYNEEDGSEEYSYLDEPRVELNKEFLTAVIDDFESFFEQLFNSLEAIPKSN